MKAVLRILNQLKEKGLIKDYAIGGAIAALRWAEPFFVQGLEVFVIVERTAEGLIVLTPIYEHFQSLGYPWKGHWIVEGIPVDLFPADPLETEAIERAAGHLTVLFQGVIARARSARSNLQNGLWRLLRPLQGLAMTPPGRVFPGIRAKCQVARTSCRGGIRGSPGKSDNARVPDCPILKGR